MKLTIKIALVISLFCSVTFAEGEMGNAGKTCTVNCLAANTTITDDKNQKDSQNDLLIFVQDFLAKIFG